MSSGSTSVEWSKEPAAPIYRGSRDFPCRESTTGLEAETGFGNALLHGEAVALGMVLAFDFAVRLGIATGQDAQRLRRHLISAGLPTRLSDIGLDGSAADRLLGHMGKDKKVRDGRITLILPRRIGEVFVVRDTPAEKLRAFLAAAR